MDENRDCEGRRVGLGGRREGVVCGRGVGDLIRLKRGGECGERAMDEVYDMFHWR